MNVISKLRLPYPEDKLFGIMLAATLLVPLVFTMGTYEHYEVPKFSLFLIAVGLGAVIFAKSNMRKKKGLDKWIFVPLVLFLASACIAAVWSKDIGNSVFGFYPRFTNGLLFYIAWAGFVFMGGKLEREKKMYLLKVLVLDALLVATFSIIQAFGIGFYTSLDAPAIQRAPGFLGNANFSTMFLAAVLPLVIYFFAEGGKKIRIYYGITIFAILWAMAMLASRGALLAAAAGIVLLLILFAFSKERLKFLGILLGVLVVGFLLSYGYVQLTRPQTIEKTVQGVETNVNLRYEVWQTSAQELLKHPFGGWGLGNYQIFFEQNREKQIAAESGVFDDAHNVFIHMAVTGGVQLMLAFLLLLAAASIKLLVLYFKTKDPFPASVLAGIASFCLAASFNPVTVGCFLALALLLIGSSAAWVTEPEMPASAVSRDDVYGTSVSKTSWGNKALVTLGILFVILGVDLIASEYIFFKGYRHYMSGDYERSVKYLNAAIAMNPTNQLYYAYRTGSEIRANPSNPNIERHISQMVFVHPTTSYSFSRAATLYFALTERTNRYEYFEKTIANINKALSMDPYFAARYGRLGYFLFRANKLDEAREAFKQSLTLDPNYLPSMVLLAKLYQIENKQTQAVFILDKAAKVRPDLTELRYWYYGAKYAKTQEEFQKVPIPIVPESGNLE